MDQINWHCRDTSLEWTTQQCREIASWEIVSCTDSWNQKALRHWRRSWRRTRRWWERKRQWWSICMAEGASITSWNSRVESTRPAWSASQNWRENQEPTLQILGEGGYCGQWTSRYCSQRYLATDWAMLSQEKVNKIAETTSRRALRRHNSEEMAQVHNR